MCIRDRHHGEFNVSEPAKIQTEVFELPTTCFAEDEGSLTNSSRLLQWHWPGQDAPFEAKTDVWIMAQINKRLRALYEKEGGAFPDAIKALTWDYKNPDEPTPEELAREINGKVLADVPDPNDPTKMVLTKGKQMAGFGALRDDGSTSCSCWIYSCLLYTSWGSITRHVFDTARRWRVSLRRLAVVQ